MNYFPELRSFAGMWRSTAELYADVIRITLYLDT